jgi:hypothetical protein
MLQLRGVKLLLISLLLILSIQGCDNTGNQAGKPVTGAADTVKIKKLIAHGSRLENTDNDSLLIISRALYQINSATPNNKAQVYAVLFKAIYYWQSADHEKAMTFAIKSLADAQKLGVRHALPEIYGLIGNLNKETTNYNMAFADADSGLNAAIKNNDTPSTIALLGLKAMFIRGLSLNRHRPELNDNSLTLNLEALKMAELKPGYEKLRIRFYDNISQYYKDKKDYDSAFYYGNKGVALAMKYNERRSLTYAYCWLGEASYAQGKQAQGLDYLNKALQIARSLNEPYRVMEIYQCFHDCYLQSKDYKDALHYLYVFTNMRDSLKVLDNVKQISELQVKYETARKDEQISSLKATEKIKALQRNTIITILFLLIVIGVLMYIKERKRKDLLFSEKCRVDIELRNASLELLYFTDNLTQKNELIEEFKAKIEQLHFQNVSRDDINSLEILVKENIMTDEKWDNFRKLFTRVHATFFNSLKQKYPQLTATDIRMLSLIKLQLGNYEMANMLGVTTEGIKKSKQRLRKKMDLHKDISLENVVDTL